MRSSFVRCSRIWRRVLPVFVAIGIAGAPPTQSQQAKLTASDATADARFGLSASLSADTALVGAYVEDGVDTGSAYVLVRDVLGNWTEQAVLTASDAAAFDVFGGIGAVSLSGDTALVGARGDEDLGPTTGSAYVFVRDVLGNWAEQAKLTASDAAAGKRFGDSVSLSGDTALIGAPGDDDPETNIGSAYVFVRDASGSWTEQTRLTASDGFGLDAFGSSVSLSGDTALIGASGDEVSAGSAYVFVRDGGGNWTEQAKLTAAVADPFDGLGVSVSVSGDTALVGAGGDDDGGDVAGAAYVFVRDGGGNWTPQTKLTASDAAADHRFGFSVSLDGDRALIGAFGNTFGALPGAAYVFDRDGGGSWTEQAKLTASDAANGDRFGVSVSLDGDTALVSAPRDDDAGTDSGSAYVFCLDGPSCGSPGALAVFGTGCPGSAGVPTLEALPGEVPSVGDLFGVKLSGLPRGFANTPIGILGLSNTDWASLALPLDAGQFGLFGCTLYVSVEATALLYNLGGSAIWRIDIPPMPELAGLPIYLQGGVLDFGVNPAGVVLTNYGQTVIIGG